MPSPKKPSPAFPLYAGDVLADTGALSATEMGVLYRLTLNCWRLRTLPADHERLARLAQVPLETLEAALPSLVDHIYRDGDCYRSAAVEKAVVEQAAFAEVQRQRAQAGWDGPRKRHKRMPRHAPACPGVPEDAERCPSASASTSDTDTASGENSAPAARAVKPIDDVTRLVAHFKAEYQRTQATPYVENRGKDRGCARRVLGSFPLAEACERATRFLEADDEFLNRTDRSLGLFAQNVNRPVVRGVEIVSANGKNNNHAGIRAYAARLAQESP